MASQWFDYRLPLIRSKRAHSVVVKPKGPISAHALFVEYSSGDGEKKGITYIIAHEYWINFLFHSHKS